MPIPCSFSCRCPSSTLRSLTISSSHCPFVAPRSFFAPRPRRPSPPPPHRTTTVTISVLFALGLVIFNIILRAVATTREDIEFSSLISQLWVALVSLTVWILYIVGHCKLSKVMSTISCSKKTKEIANIIL